MNVCPWSILYSVKAPYLDQWELIANDGMAVSAWYQCRAPNEKS